MQFYEAMRILFEDGEKVRRKTWAEGEYIFVNPTMQCVFRNTEKEYLRYTPSREDMFAIDWEIAQ